MALSPGIKSFVNQPTRIFLSSDNDTSTPRTGAYNQFSITFQTPILGARRAQLLRCTIPNASATGVTIPDYMTEFWYYQLPANNTAVTPPTPTSATITAAAYNSGTGVLTYTATNTYLVDMIVTIVGVTVSSGSATVFNITGQIITASGSQFTINTTTGQSASVANINTGTATSTQFNPYLKCVRLYPSNFVPASGYSTYSKNRFFSNPSDLVTALNVAAAAGGDNVVYNPAWKSADVSFAYNSTTQQITMTGLTSGKYYAIAGYNDPSIAINSLYITIPLFNGGTLVQSWLAGYTMNLRVGYALSGLSSSLQGTTTTNTNILYANLTNTTFAQNAGIPPDAFPDLVYTQNVYLYSSLCVGSSATSNKRNNLLSVAPITANQLVVSQYIALTLNYLQNVADTIYTISIEMRDDNDQSFYLNDNNTVNVELALSYVDV